MSESMRERLARAIVVAGNGACLVQDWEGEAARNPGVALALKIADAVLDAIMVPTEEMNAAGFLRNLELGGGKRSPEATFQAMIRAAKEGK